MARPEDVVRLRYILNAAQKAVAFCRGRTRTDLEEDEVLTLALARLVQIIGESAKAVLPATPAAAPEVPRREVTGTQDRLVHGYAEAELGIIWAIVTEDLPPLITELQRHVSPETN